MTIASPEKCATWTNTGAREVLDIADAVVSNWVKLDSLTLVGATYQMWGPDLRSPEDVESLKGLYRPLRRLRCDIQTERDIEDIEDSDPEDETWDPTNKWADGEADATFKTGSYMETLAEAANLRVLKLRLWQRSMDDHGTANLENALGDLHFSYLYDLALGDCKAELQYLVGALLRHKITLRRLSLSNVRLLGRGPGWRSALIALAGQLQNMRKVRLRGCLSSMWGVNLNCRSPEADPWKDDVEDFVLHGGAPPWDDQNRVWGDREYLSSCKGHAQPCLLEDNTESDDSVLDYDLDDFDAASDPPARF